VVKEIRRFDPDILLTSGGDFFIFPYLARRALLHNILNQFILSREESPLVAE